MKTFEALSARIGRNKTLGRDRVYAVQGEVGVLQGVKLTVEDGVNVLLVNGVRFGELGSPNDRIRGIKATTADGHHQLRQFSNSKPQC